MCSSEGHDTEGELRFANLTGPPCVEEWRPWVGRKVVAPPVAPREEAKRPTSLRLQQNLFLS